MKIQNSKNPNYLGNGLVWLIRGKGNVTDVNLKV